MSRVPVAAFDPIFWLHHTQIDRLLSLWSALNPGVGVTNGSSLSGTWTIPPNKEIGVNTDLRPFRKTQASYWTSAAVSDTPGYTYPEFNGLDMGNTAAVRDAIARKVNELYAGTRGNFSRFTATAPESSSLESTLLSNIAADEASLASSEFESIQVWEWSARVHVKQYEIGESFQVLFFLGSIPSDPRNWITAETFVGGFYGFVNDSPEQCANCQTQQDDFLEGFVHLNIGIAECSSLNSFDESVVKPYLTSNLNWGVQKASGEVVDLTNMPSLEITAVATPLTLSPGAHFPVPGEIHHYHDITLGRLGGSNNRGT